MLTGALDEAAPGPTEATDSKSPNGSMGYVNLGNVYFIQGQYEKALEGYRKAESIDPEDPVCQYNLAQAFIKTLLIGC